MRRWGLSIAMFVCAGVFGGVELAIGSIGYGLAVLLFFVVLGVLTSPRAFPRSLTDAEARALSAQDGRPIVYWRPGCPFCMRLRASIGRRASRLHWVDIWADPEGAASVRAVANGNETVPTVVTPHEAMVNPNPHVVRELARR